MNTRTSIGLLALGAGLIAISAGAQTAEPAAAPAPTGQALPDRAPPQLEGLEVEPGGLTAKEVARRALAISPSVKQKEAALTAANEKITQTMMQFMPKVSANASYTRLSNVVSLFQLPGGGSFAIPVVLDNWSLEGHLSVPLSDYVLRTLDAAKSSSAAKESARIAVEAEKLSVAAQAETLYFNWLRSRAEVAISRHAVERTQARLQDAKSSFEVGAISKADLLRIEALVANTEVRLNAAETAQMFATGQLAIMMEDWHPNYRVGEGIPAPSDIPPADPDGAKLVAEGQAKRLEVHAVDQAIAGLSHGASATRAGALPRVDGFGDAFYANPNQRYFPPQSAWHGTWDVGVRATWILDDIVTQSSAARELDANAQSTIEQRRLVKAGVANEVLGAYLGMARARAAVEKQQVALAAAEEGYRVTTDLFKAGRATSTDLI
jgi:outer membrane protein TolC